MKKLFQFIGIYFRNYHIQLCSHNLLIILIISETIFMSFIFSIRYYILFFFVYSSIELNAHLPIPAQYINTKVNYVSTWQAEKQKRKVINITAAVSSQLAHTVIEQSSPLNKANYSVHHSRGRGKPFAITTSCR